MIFVLLSELEIPIRYKSLYFFEIKFMKNIVEPFILF